VSVNVDQHVWEKTLAHLQTHEDDESFTTEPNDPAAFVRSRLDECLALVEKPARYTGGEFNTTLKPDAEIDVRLALAFPDVYDIGMSYHGFKIFYERVNRIQGFQCERTFAPWPDFEAVMRRENLPLYMLESKRPLAQADVVGFTLQHEMNYTNLLNMLDLARIPIHARDRSESDPIVIAGGHGAFNPEVLGDFIDAFVIGDGEWGLIQILETVRRAKLHNDALDKNQPGFATGDSAAQPAAFTYKGDGSRAKRRAVPTFGIEDINFPGPWKDFSQLGENRVSREELLLHLSMIPGVYVPRFYAPDWNEDGTLNSVRRLREDVPETISKSNFDVRDDSGCVMPVVPLMRVVHDRFAIEIKRGCMVGCRFCQAGMITRPLRERDPRQIVEIARAGIRNTGYDEISLLSLSSADYSGILELTRSLKNELAGENISISLPSLRINAFDVDLAEEIGSVRKSGFTFAPEAGTARLRQVINKAVDEQRFHDTIEAVLQKGWRTLKFYFMCGLPTETDEDLQGIVDLTNKAIEMGRRHCGKNFQLNISLSPFIPKPQTPFQWHAQPTIEEFEAKYQYIQTRIDRRFVNLKRHSLKESVIEGVLGRGDRRVGQVIYEAWKLGCKFDNWHEHMRFDLWQQAFENLGFDPHFYANRARGKDESFAWDHIDASLGRKFLWKEKTKSELVKITTDCSTTHCATCQVCDFKEVKNVLSIREDGEYFAPGTPAEKTRAFEPVQRMRITFAKTGLLRFTSHLDIVKVVQLIFRRCQVEVAYSQGFNPAPKIVFTPPLPMGFASEGEMMDVYFTEEFDPETLLRSLRSIPVEGLEWIAAEVQPLRGPSVTALLHSARYRITVPESSTLGDESDLMNRFLAAETFEVQVESKTKLTVRDLKATVFDIQLDQSNGQLFWCLEINFQENKYMNPVVAVEKILGRSLENYRATRLAFSVRQTEALV